MSFWQPQGGRIPCHTMLPLQYNCHSERNVSEVKILFPYSTALPVRCHSEMRSVEKSPTKYAYGMRSFSYIRDDSRDSSHAFGMTYFCHSDNRREEAFLAEWYCRCSIMSFWMQRKRNEESLPICPTNVMSFWDAERRRISYEVRVWHEIPHMRSEWH